MQAAELPKLDQKSFGTGVKSYSGCLLEVIDEFSGLVCGDDEHLYSYEISRNEDLTKKRLTPSKLKIHKKSPKIVKACNLHLPYPLKNLSKQLNFDLGPGKFIDLIFFKKQNFGFFYTNQYQNQIVQFDSFGRFADYLTCQTDSSPTKGKMLRKDPNENNLFINQGSFLQILFNVGIKTFESEGNLRQFDSSTISEFRTLGRNGVLTACSNMQLYYHEVDASQGTRLVCKIDIGVPVNENITAMNICPFSKYIAVATEDQRVLTNLVLFEIRKDQLIEFKDEMNFYLDSVFRREFNFLADLSLQIYCKGFPLICGFTMAGDRLLMPFGFDGRRLTRFGPIKYSSGIVNRCSVTRDSIWTLDMNGVLKRLRLANIDY